MEYVYFGFAVLAGIILCVALGFSILSYKKTNSSMNMIVRLIHHSANEIGAVGRSVDTVVKQNGNALEQQKRTSDHQRVLLASLNRQLITLETMFERQGKSQLNTVANQKRRLAEEFVAPVQAQAEAATHNPVRHPQASVSQATQAAAPRRQAPAYQERVYQENAQAPQTLDNLVASADHDGARTGARIPLAQRLRLQKHMEKQQAQAVKPQQSAVHPAPNRVSPVQTRETIDVLKMKERRVANG